MDASGNKVADYSYDHWGNVLSPNESATVANQPLGYASYVYHRHISKYYFQARFYKPADGVFLSRDPVFGTPTNLMEQNGYSYSNGNPVMGLEPNGGFTEVLGVFLIPGVGEAAGVVVVGGLAYLAWEAGAKPNNFIFVRKKSSCRSQDIFEKKAG